MAETLSSMLELGTPLPTVVLDDVVTGKPVDVSAAAKGAKGLVVAFLCNHCPYVVHLRAPLVRLLNDAVERGVSAVAINSNDVTTYPQDGPLAMARLATSEQWRFPFLLDSTQEVAKAFRAACTPDFFVFDAAQRLAYRGQFDDSRPGNGKPVTGRDLGAAIDALVAGKVPSVEQTPSVGCNIKWRRG
jgi:hypothetical protein